LLVPASRARVEQIVGSVSTLDYFLRFVQEYVGTAGRAGTIALNALHEIGGGSRRLELGAHCSVVEQGPQKKEIPVAVTDVERRQRRTVLQRVRQVSDAVHPIGEIRRLREALACKEVDQQFHRLIDRRERGGRLAADRKDDFLRCRNDQLAVLDIVPPSDHATDADDEQREQCCDANVKR